MEKQAYLPIKFYPAKEWQEYEKLKNYGGDYVIVKEYNNIPPAFQIVIPDIGRHWSADSFILGTFDLVNYDTGTTYDMNAASYPQVPIVYRSDGYRTLVWRRFPATTNIFDEGRYYYHLIEAEDETEWFSEVFELCDLELDALIYDGGVGFDGESGFATFVSGYVLSNRMADVEFCKASAAAPAYAYMPVEVFLEEELDLYVYTYDRDGVCDGIDRDWDNPVFFYLKTSDGVLISDICRVDTTETFYHFNLKAQAGGTVRLYMYILDADKTEGNMWIGLYRTHVEKHVQLRWFNDTNFCKIVYDQFPEFTPFQYENIYFLDAKQIIDENSINENVVEDDAANKYRIVGTDQKWNSLQMFGSECLLNAMSLLRLHSNVKVVKETGEPIDTTEIMLEQSVVSDEGALMKLVYREESCSKDNCGFDVCCPTIGIPTLIGLYNGVGALPATASYPGRYAMVETAPLVWQIYYSSGAAWAVNTSLRVAGTCVEIQNNQASFSSFPLHHMRFWHVNIAETHWEPFIWIDSVGDATGGLAAIITYTEQWIGPDVLVQAEYYAGTQWEAYLPYFDNENWIKCSTIETSTVVGALGLTCNCGAGTGIWFRVHMWDNDCDYGYTPPIQQTIT